MDPVIGIVGVLLGGGLAGALVAAFKAGPERESISVETLRGVIKELRTEAGRLRAVVTELEGEVSRKDRQIEAQERQIDKQQDQIEELLARIRPRA